MRKKITDEELIISIQEIGILKTAKKYKLDERQLRRRRRNLEYALGQPINSPMTGGGNLIKQTQSYPHRSPLEVSDGVVIVAGDAHYWPGEPTLMHRALVMFIKRFRDERRLRAVIMNGDVTDLSTISRWPVVNWEKRPSVAEEIEVCQDRMQELAEAAGKAKKFWPLGNHDARWSIYLAEHVPEFAKVQGLHLKDSFPLWEPCWSVEINKNTIVKHRFRSGVHATYNNVLHSGINIITNDLHSAQIRPYTDYTGTRWAVDCGCIADVNAQAFLYMEDNPRNWRQGFAILTFKNGQLVSPELVLRWEYGEEQVQFRGDVIVVPK